MRERCKVEGCDRDKHTRGWCTKHYARWREHGDPLTVKQGRVPRPADGKCTIEGCDRDYYYSGMCSGHYVRRMRKSAAPESPLEDRFYDPEENFAAHTRAGDGCTEWTGWLSPGGYGKFKTGGKCIFAHRYAWERVNGPIPEGMVIDHACHNTACVNVDHLRLATPAQNTRNLNGPKANNKHSGVRNVGKLGDKWRVRITKDGVVHYFGCFESLSEASRVAASGRSQLFGQFAGRG